MYGPDIPRYTFELLSALFSEQRMTFCWNWQKREPKKTPASPSCLSADSWLKLTPKYCTIERVMSLQNEITVSWHLGHPEIFLDGETADLVQIDLLDFQAFYVLRWPGLSLFTLAPARWGGSRSRQECVIVGCSQKALGSKDHCRSLHANLF